MNRAGPWLRCAGLALVLCLVAPAATVAEGGSELSAPLAHAQSVAGTRLLIDVRSPAEWRQTGLPAKAHAITIHQPGGMNAFLASIDKLTGGDKSKPIALICASGVRSAHQRIQR